MLSPLSGLTHLGLEGYPFPVAVLSCFPYEVGLGPRCVGIHSLGCLSDRCPWWATGFFIFADRLGLRVGGRDCLLGVGIPGALAALPLSWLSRWASVALVSLLSVGFRYILFGSGVLQASRSNSFLESSFSLLPCASVHV